MGALVFCQASGSYHFVYDGHIDSSEFVFRDIHIQRTGNFKIKFEAHLRRINRLVADSPHSRLVRFSSCLLPELFISVIKMRVQLFAQRWEFGMTVVS